MSGLHALRTAFDFMVDVVTDIVFEDDGSATSSGADGDDLSSEIGYHFGFYSRPLDGAMGIVVKAGGKGATSFLLGWRDGQFEMSLEKGECGLQNAFNAHLLLDKNGHVLVNADDTGKGAARQDDTVNCGWLYWVPNVPPGGAASLAYLPPDTTPTPNNILYPPPGTLFALRGKIDSSSGTVKIG